MDFFEHQDAARRNTVKLVVLFILAVIGIVIATDGVVLVAYHWLAKVETWRWWRPVPLGIGTALTLAIIGERMSTKTLQLRSGGGAVAQMMGGTPLTSPASDADRKFRNVVEEMSIASGCRAPELYVLRDERGINAFAAGTTPDNAAISVTQGCIERLSRDELQGVIAHEFSHILNGDMRLNSRLIGIIYGILGIGLIGMALIRSLAYTGSTFRRRRKNDDGRATIVILLAGLALAAIGYVGTFFGRMIQSAISRQREYLADASAVQFTRNPTGIAGALKKIGGFGRHGSLTNPHAGEIAHMFFATGFPTPLSQLMNSMFATHPPLEDRIRRIQPDWDGVLPKLKRDAPTYPEAVAGFAGSAARQPRRSPLSANEVVGRVGRVRPEDVEYAGALIANIPPALREATQEPYSARAVCFATLLDADEVEREKQLDLLRKFEPPLTEEVVRLAALTEKLGERGRLPLVDLCLPALARMSDIQAANFCRLLRQSVEIDGKVTPFEFALFNVIVRHLRACPISGEKVERRGGHIHSIRPLLDPIRLLLSVLAKRSDNPHDAWQTGLSRIAPELAGEAMPEMPMSRLSLALEELDHGSPGVKRRVLDAAAHCVAADGIINVREAELLRGVAAALDLPLPPLVQGAMS